MRISYDPEVDALSIIFRETEVTTEHLAEGVAADYDADGHLAGIEILDASLRPGARVPFGCVELQGIAPAVAV